VQCHIKPTDVLSQGHAFDSTPGVAEVVMSGGLSPAGTYTAGTCANNYCHGNGINPATIKTNVTALKCNACHPDITSSNAWGQMSGQHALHLGFSGVDCTTCHNQVVQTDPSTIADKTLHIDGKKEVAFSVATISFNASTRTCTGSCHGQGHNNRW
jgi:predicted CxxxxCH...CXXCH cytochrome family protein